MLTLFAFLAITIWMFENGKKRYSWMAIIPGSFYTFATTAYIMNAKIGFNLPWNIAYILGALVALAYAAILVVYGNKRAANKENHLQTANM